MLRPLKASPIAMVAAVAAVVVVVAAVNVALFAGPGCDPGRTCVPAAGVSLVLPDGWKVEQPQEKDELLGASPGRDSPYGLFIARGSDELSAPIPTDLDGLEAALEAWLTPSTGVFQQIDASAVDRVTLPIGPAVRARWADTTGFIMYEGSEVASYWCFVRGQLIEIQYVVDTGEDPPTLLTDVPADVAAAIASLRVMGATASPAPSHGSNGSAVMPTLPPGAPDSSRGVRTPTSRTRRRASRG